MTLSDLIDSEPLNAARNDAEVLAWLSETITVQGRVSHSDVMKWGATGPRLKLSNAAVNGAMPDGLRAASLTALDLLQDGATTFDTGDAGNVALLDGLVAGGVLSASDKSALMTLGEQSMARYESHGLPPVKLGHVEAAR